MLNEFAADLNGRSDGHHTNSVHTQDYAPCASDYGPAPAPEAPQPKWRDEFPKFTHNLSWCDSDGISHSMTVRSDDANELLAIIKGVKNIIRASKQKAAGSAPSSETPPDTQPDTQRCAIHGVDMPRRWSKRTNGHYFGHKLADGGLCYGRTKA